jgi:predicted DCC family thiol-disulfide oxidoreductase YuxK
MSSEIPASAPVPAPVEPDRLFYDGDCGLCHGAVRFVVGHDPAGTAFRFAPLGGPTFLATFSPSARSRLPDSIVIRTADGRTLTRWPAVLHIGQRAGGLPARLANAGWLLPGWLGDLAYDAIARIRKQLFATPSDTCPVAPVELRRRFDP